MKRSSPPYAGRLERTFAYIIDSAFLLVLTELFALIGGANSALALIGSLACQMAYITVFTASRWQATPGQRMMGMHVARLDGKPLSERDAFERFLAFIMPTLPMYLSIAPLQVLATATTWLILAWFLPILLREDRRGVHDVLCGTHVLEGRK